MSLKRGKPKAKDPLDEQLEDLQKIKLDINRFILGCIPCIERDGQYELLAEAEYQGQKISARQLRRDINSTELHNALMRDPHLAPYMSIPSKDNGFDIEGLSLQGERIFIGLRGPVLRGYALILEIQCGIFENELILKRQADENLFYRKHFIDLAGMGIRELHYHPEGDLYVLAGPTMDLDGHISLFRIKGGLKNQYASMVRDAELLFDISPEANTPRGYNKAEGIAFLSDTEILVTYDAPSPERMEGKEGIWMDIFGLD